MDPWTCSPKLLTPSPLREGGGASFAPPLPPASSYDAPTGTLPLPSLLALTRADANALPDCCDWLPAAPGCAEAIVIGTAHVSKHSVDEVTAAIAALRPDCVLLELCGGREQMIERVDIATPPTLDQMMTSIADGADLFSVVYPWFLATVAESLEVTPGAEFQAAFLAASALSEGQVLVSNGADNPTGKRQVLGYMSEADAVARTKQCILHADTADPEEVLVMPAIDRVEGSEQQLTQEQQLWVGLYNARAACACPVVLADRHISATVSRIWGSLTPWDRVRLLVAVLWQGLQLPDAEELSEQMEALKQGKDLITEAVIELSADFPAFTAVLIDERDEWLAQQLYSCCRNDVIERTDDDGNTAPAWPKRVVAVVGAGHVPGMERYWEEVAVGKGPRADLAAAFAPFPKRPHDRRNSWLIGLGLTAVAVAISWGAWKGSRAYPGWARQASQTANCVAVMTGVGVVGGCCFGDDDDTSIERLERNKRERTAKETS